MIRPRWELGQGAGYRGAAMPQTSISIPRPVQLVIDDVGWREGWDLSARGGPWRAGVNRLLGPSDYHAIANIGQALAIRPQAAMVLCEWDKENVCAQFPTTTQHGRAWDNSSRVGPWADEAAEIFVERAEHIELALHGVGHEHWEDGQRFRAEWFGRDPSEIWDTGVLRSHAHCFRQILDQHRLGPDWGSRFPPSFVPAAFRFYWNNSDPQSTGALMHGLGVRYCSTPFASCCFLSGEPERPDGGFDHQLIVLDRGGSGVPWDAFAAVPDELPTTSICGCHWPNVLMEDPAANEESVAAWVAYLRQIEAAGGWTLGRNMAETVSQWLYHSFATFAGDGLCGTLDTAAIPTYAKLNRLAENVVVKLPLAAGDHVAGVRATGCRAVACCESAGWGHVTLRPERLRCSFEVQVGRQQMPLVVLRKGAYDVLDLAQESSSVVRLRVRVYGRQLIDLRLPFTMGTVESSNPNLIVRGVDNRPGAPDSAIVLEGRDIHGEEGEITITL